MTTTNSGQITLSEFTGELLTRGDAGYDDARRVWNGAIDRYPAFIARCHTPGDVVAGLRLARRHGLPVAVRGGGHSIPGHSVCEGGLMLDLSPMRAITVDPHARTAEVAPGVLWREFDAAAQIHGLATPGGEISDTGVAGLTLGGHRLAQPSAWPGRGQPDRRAAGDRRRDGPARRRHHRPRTDVGTARRRRQFRDSDRLPIPAP